MWTTQRDQIETAGPLRLTFFRNTNSLSYAEFLRALADDPDFRDILMRAISSAPFIALRWETPPVTTDTLRQPFSCILHDSPDLDVPADPTDFAAHIGRISENNSESKCEVACFDNLGADALLVAPCPTDKSANYSHIASFHRSAPLPQQHIFWKAVARATSARISAQPLWLSTAGGGVDWLHARLDTRPKYYRHRPWREWQHET